MNELSFIRTLSVAKFKEETKSSAIDVVRNPNSGKLFFVADSGIKGAVSENFSENPCVSEVSGSEGTFWLLHKKQSDNVLVTL